MNPATHPGTNHAVNSRAKKTSRGFTLVELMVTMTVIVILMAAAPTFVSIIKNNRQAIEVNTLLMAMAGARDEAIKRNTQVSVCQTSDGEECTDEGWHEGWMIFSDGGVAGKVDGADTILQVFPGVSADTTLSSESFPEFVAFISDGTSNAAGGFMLCDDRGEEHAVSLCVAATGRVTSATHNCAGGAIECP